ncbi:MAG: hypothetical protein ACI9ON_001676 [Limisphaerales bacterium]|jgi:hypothetical protein
MAKRDLYIPERPEELTPTWLNEVLAARLGDNKIVDAPQTILGEGEGFVGDIVQLKLKYERESEDLPASIIAKMPKLANRAMGELLGAYERENMFYMTMGDDLPVRSPLLYYGEFDRDAGSEKQEQILRAANKIPNFLQGLLTRFAWWMAAGKKRRYILLIEDISGAQPCDQLQGVNREQYQKILEATARLHADFWQSDRLQGQFWLLPLDVDIEMRHQMMVRARQAYTNLFPETVAAGMDRYLDEVERDGTSLAHSLCDGPVTLMHGDLRLDNLFFADDEVLFIDWQLVRRGAPMYDIAYLLSCGLEDKESAQPLIQAYYAALVAEGINDYSLEDAWRDYQTALKVVLMILSSVDQVDLGAGRGVTLLEKWMARLLNRLEADCD